MPEPSEKNRAKGKYWDLPWTLVENCTPVSEACDHCWLTGMAARFGKAGPVRFRADRLDVPARRRKPAVFPVWSDIFHPAVSDCDRDSAYEVMERCVDTHTFIVLTKRAYRMKRYVGWRYEGRRIPAHNIIHGVTAENQPRLEERLPDLLATPAATRMLSVEPMLGPMAFLCLAKTPPEIHWVVLGCESGPRRRPTPWTWLESAVEQCAAAGVAVWVKQMAERPDGTGRVMHDMAAFPPWARRREWPLRKENERC
ncbi:MAG TPA: DUF5131 family protein [Phycisphaerae bacterium]|nr:DUF5131 family protein [Phycisphaerae bacterium]